MARASPVAGRAVERDPEQRHREQRDPEQRDPEQRHREQRDPEQRDPGRGAVGARRRGRAAHGGPQRRRDVAGVYFPEAPRLSSVTPRAC